jgi:hypothetical protein
MLVNPKSHKVVPSLIEEVPVFKDFIKPCIARGRDMLIGTQSCSKKSFVLIPCGSRMMV